MMKRRIAAVLAVLMMLVCAVLYLMDTADGTWGISNDET